MSENVTVVIPTYNRSKLLKETIMSVLNQTYKDFDLLICDNASTDDTEEVVKMFNDERIIYYKHKSNIGMQRNWRFALTYPKTNYVALLSDDDLYLPHHLEIGICELENNENSSFYACASQIIGISKSNLFNPEWAELTDHIYTIKPTENYTNWLKGPQIASPSLIIRSNSLNSITEWGGINWPSCMDYMWWGQLAMCGDFIYNTTPGVVYRWHDNNVSHEWYKKRRWSAVEFRYTVKTLANLAFKQKIIYTNDIFTTVLKWKPNEVAALVLSLSTKENEKELRDVAYKIFKYRPDLKQKKSSRHTWLSGIIGSWYLKYADKLDRVIAKWPPEL